MRKLWRWIRGKPTFTISAVVIRADGTREELGVISTGYGKLEVKA